MQPDNESSPLLPEEHEAKRLTQRFWLKIGCAALILGIVIGLVWIILSRDSDKTRKTAPSKSTTTTNRPLTPSTATPQFDATVLLGDRKNIWELAFLPSGEMLFTEREGKISFLKDSKVTEVARLDDVKVGSEGGLMGLAVDPEFNSNRFIYACLSTAADARIVRWKLASNLSGLTDRKDIVSGLPENTKAYPGRHAGCRIGFGPDGYLWAGTGDSAQGDTSIQPTSLGGKVLRVDRDGKAAPGNLTAPFDQRIYSYGHRNIQGLAFFKAQKNGVLGLTSEHGPGKDDEINELRVGNFGWAPPKAGYMEEVPMTDTVRFPDAIEAIWSSGSPTLAPAGAVIINGAQWEGWNGALAVTMLKSKHLHIFRLDDKNQVIKEEKVLEDTYGRLRTVIQGPDGSLYIGTGNNGDDKIVKLTLRQ